MGVEARFRCKSRAFTPPVKVFRGHNIRKGDEAKSVSSPSNVNVDQDSRISVLEGGNAAAGGKSEIILETVLQIAVGKTRDHRTIVRAKLE